MALQSSEPPNGSASADDVVARKPFAKNRRYATRPAKQSAPAPSR
jgi:hypothetical protein